MVYRFKIFLFIKNKSKNRKLFETLVMFSFLFSKWNNGKLGDRYAIFLFFHFLNTMPKMKKKVRINIIFFFFPFFYFLGKTKK